MSFIIHSVSCDERRLLTVCNEQGPHAKFSRRQRARFRTNLSHIRDALALFNAHERFEHLGLSVDFVIAPSGAQPGGNTPVALVSVTALEEDFPVAPRGVAWPGALLTARPLELAEATPDQAKTWALNMIRRCVDMLSWLEPLRRWQAFGIAIADADMLDHRDALMGNPSDAGDALSWAYLRNEPGGLEVWAPLSRRRICAIADMAKKAVLSRLEYLAHAVVTNILQDDRDGVHAQSFFRFSGYAAGNIDITVEKTAFVVQLEVIPLIGLDFKQLFTIKLPWPDVESLHGVTYALFMTTLELQGCSGREAFCLAARYASTIEPPTEEDEGTIGAALASAMPDDFLP